MKSEIARVMQRVEIHYILPTDLWQLFFLRHWAPASHLLQMVSNSSKQTWWRKIQKIPCIEIQVVLILSMTFFYMTKTGQ